MLFRSKQMLVKGSKVSRRSVRSKEIGQVGRLKVLKCLEGQGGNFEMNTLMNRKPMKFLKRGSNMVVTPNRRIDNTGQGIWHFLKPVKGYSGKTIVQ